MFLSLGRFYGLRLLNTEVAGSMELNGEGPSAP